MNTYADIPQQWPENVIVVDAEYVDSVAFDLIVNFERMIGRHIPPADLPRWIDCIALDGGMKIADGDEGRKVETMVVMVTDGRTERLENFTPSHFATEINEKAFADNLGEFTFSVVSHEDLTTKAEMIADIAAMATTQKELRRLMIVPNADDAATLDLLRRTLRSVDDDKRITIFAMQPIAGGNFRQEILGYSLMNALGIRADEIK